MFGSQTNAVEELHKRAGTASFKLIFPTGMKSMPVSWADAQRMAVAKELAAQQPRIMFDPE